MVPQTLNIEEHGFIKSNWAFSFTLLLFIISTIGFFGFVDPGEKKQGRIIIDEGHSNWEWTTEEFNTKCYGEKSTYNYWSLAEFLNHYFIVDRNKDKLTDETLCNYDILFIKTPTEPFSLSEIESIKRFVKRGGGLFMVGDHTNVFGITTNLNPLASEFGIKFRYDGQYDISGELSLFKKPLLLPHPTVQYMPPFMFATGCMLDAPLMAENSIIGYGLKSIYLDYSRPNFFPKDAANTGEMEFGIFAQSAGLLYGKGRVFLFTDSTVLSNFYMFMPGKPELILGIMDWLNRKNSVMASLRFIFIIILLCSLIIQVIFLRRMKKPTPLFLSALLGLIIVPIVIKGYERLNYFSYPVLKEHTKFVKVSFEAEHSDIELPVVHIISNFEKSYHTFYVWLQRVGIVPYLMNSYEGALKEGNAVVVINPSKSFSVDEVSKTKIFLKQGGKLLLIDNPSLNNYAVANELLSRLGVPLRLNSNLAQEVSIFKSKNDSLKISAQSAGYISGGKQILFARTKNIHYSELESDGRIDGIKGVEKTKLNIAEIQKEQNILMLADPDYGVKIRKFLNEKRNKAQHLSIDTLSIRTVMSKYQIGKGEIVLLANSNLFTDKEMGNTSTRPSKNQLNISKLEYWLFNEILKLK
ncbi:MAG: hypothetical protein Q8933_08330 [Bacteroidota bacterium]|nr:hypothetical protein [Bacteroidota bacterium]